MFEGIVCWQPDRVYTVVSTEAENTPPPVFMAVHTPHPLTDGASANSQRSLTERQFLEEFLAANRNHVQAVVLGEAGTGKSHLIQWLALNIPPSEHRAILSIPRAGTTLRGILSSLIELLDEKDREPYESRLRNARQAATSLEELYVRLLGSLTAVLTRAQASDDIQKFLRDGLGAFLTDPTMREYHTGKGGIITELARHISEPGGEAREARRSFSEDDLHLDDAMRRIQEFAAPTQRFLRQLQTANFRKQAVDMLNGCLDDAVTEVLGFTGDELVALMSEIRRHLGAQSKELILLFEDFARAEGIDRSLLDALVEQSTGQPGEPAVLRWAIAVTRGYYENSLLETHRARMDFVIDMALKLGQEVDNAGLVRFAARYLNALRLNEAELAKWYESLQAGDDLPVRNACAGCPHREECHAAFGAASVVGLDEVGLYPFTPEALLNMYERRSTDQSFNPRTLLDQIVKPIADGPRARDIANGDFPDSNLLSLMGGPKLKPDVVQRVRANHGQLADRYLTLLELWSGEPGTPGKLHDGVYRAFGLAPLNSNVPVVATPPPGTSPEPGPSAPGPATLTQPVNAALKRRLDAITDWANGGVFTQDLANYCRALVYAAIHTYIDWDELHAASTALSGAEESRPFRRRSIYFRNQQVGSPLPGPVSVELPLRDSREERNKMALALEGLVNFEHHRSWQYDGAGAQMLALAECLSEWSGEVVRQLTVVADPQGQWDGIETAVEVLVTGAALAGHPAGSPNAWQRADAIFGPWPDPNEMADFAPEWRTLYRAVFDRKDALADFVRQRATLGKGGQAGAMVDAVRIVPVVRALASNWQLRHSPPERLATGDADRPYRDILALHRRLQSELAAAVESERARRSELLRQVREYMPQGTARADVVKALTALRDASSLQGIPVPPGLNGRVQEALEEFSRVQLDEAIRTAESLDTIVGLEALEPLAGGRRLGALEAAVKFFAVADEYMGRVDNELQSRNVAGGDDIPALVREVGEAFDDVDSALAALEEDA